MNGPAVDATAQPCACEHVVVQVDSLAVRLIGAAALLCAVAWVILILAHQHQHSNRYCADRLDWALTILAAVALITRGIFFRRPVTATHAVTAAVAVLVGLGSHLLSLDLFADFLVGSSGMVLMWPTSARPRPDDLSRVWPLINVTRDDPLAPFAMQTGKCYHITEDGSAALAYRTRMGYAVASGDPVGEDRKFPELVAGFAAMCHAHGWRIAVVGCSERRLALWSDSAVVGQRLRPIPIGRDVVVDVTAFEMVGRKFRNLRQAVKRTHNAGITTEIVAEQELGDGLFAELTDVVRAAPSGAYTDRGFYMNLDGVLEGRFPGIQLIIARDASGRVQGFHRYATAGNGSDISLDVPWRRRGSSNGIDERLSADMITAAKERGAQRVSLCFAAFPEIFEDTDRDCVMRVFYRSIHILDPLIALESLYRYVRKFHALGARRYALISMTQLVPLMVVLLTLEFMPRRRSAAKAAKARWNQSQ